MKIRLSIQDIGGKTRSVESSKSLVSIGRDPESAVAFEGEAGKGVSWNHAVIQFQENKLTIMDAASSNGTLLNDKMLPPNQPMTLKLKDRIQLGYTGPAITVSAFDPSWASTDPEPTGKGKQPAKRNDSPSRKMSPWIAAAVALVLGLGLIWQFTGKAKNDNSKVDPNAVSKDAGAVAPEFSKAAASTNANKTESAPIAKAAPPSVGRLIKKDEAFPGTLLQWPGEPYAWAPVANNGRVEFGQLLLALPGFRCQIQCDTGVAITALSNLPEFDREFVSPDQLKNLPLVLETSWIHKVPEVGVDTSLIFDRGRLHFYNGKPSGSARIKIEMRNAEWEIILKDAASQVVVETYFSPLIASKLGQPLDAKNEPLVNFFTTGSVLLKRSDKSFTLDGRNGIFQEPQTRNLIGPKPLPAWPYWWNANLSNPKNEFVLDAVRSIREWADIIEKSDEVLKVVIARCEAEKNENLKPIAYLILASFGEIGEIGQKAISKISEVVESTEESEASRLAALYSLQVWLYRSARHLDLLMQTVIFKLKKYSPTEAEQILRLTIAPAKEDEENSVLYQEWVSDLESSKSAVRFLAWERLKQVLKEGAAASINDFNPNKDPKDPDQMKLLKGIREKIPAGWTPKAK